MFAARLDHLLLLHLEGSEIHWKGKHVFVLFFFYLYKNFCPIISLLKLNKRHELSFFSTKPNIKLRGIQYFLSDEEMKSYVQPCLLVFV